jgi:hypothetical protein
MIPVTIERSKLAPLEVLLTQTRLFLEDTREELQKMIRLMRADTEKAYFAGTGEENPNIGQEPATGGRLGPSPFSPNYSRKVLKNA